MKPIQRRKARQLALQAIYQWQFKLSSIDEIKNQYLTEANPKKVDIDYFSELLLGVTNSIEDIDAAITPNLDRKISKLNPIELAILRIATFELLFRKDVPYKTAINEAVETAKIFGAKESHKYINGVLDKIARKKAK